VNIGDLNVALSNYNAHLTAAAAVPEPSTLALLAACAVGLLARTWRRRLVVATRIVYLAL
jgi:hypothetical protein